MPFSITSQVPRKFKVNASYYPFNAYTKIFGTGSPAEVKRSRIFLCFNPIFQKQLCVKSFSVLSFYLHVSVNNGHRNARSRPSATNIFTYVCFPLCSALSLVLFKVSFNPYPTAFPYGNGVVLHFYQQQESSTTKTVHKVINKGLKAYV